MSMKHKAVVKNGAIQIETPELPDGTVVEIDVNMLSPVEKESLFERLGKLSTSGLPDDFSVSHKPKENHE
jgi:hypothetical protein